MRTEEEKDKEIHDATVAEAKERIAEIADVDYLKEIRAREERHPKHVGGRKGVLEAIDEQIAKVTPPPAAQPPAPPAPPPAASAAPESGSLVRCRVKANAGDFHLRRKVKKDGELVEVFEKAAPGTELRLTPAEFRQNAGNLEAVD